MAEATHPESKPVPGAEHIIVVIGRTRHKMVQAEIQEAGRRGARVIEVRLDFLAKAPDFKRLLDNKPCPMIATVRRPIDGGRWPGSEEARLMLLRQAIVAGFDWVDLETDIIDKVPRFKTVKRIVSYHNMRSVPADLEQIHARMCDQDADVVKIAVRTQHPGENLRLLELVRTAKRPTIAMGMGDLGMPSRILGAKYGAPFTYGAFNKERGIAPGLPSFDELQRVFFYEHINAHTRVFGVVGDPIGHSLSPLVHNTAFRQLGINAVYLPFRVPRPDLITFFKDWERIPVEGYSVTLPHKEVAASLALVRDEMVNMTQSANTLVRRVDGNFSAYNTDYRGATDSLLAHMARATDGRAPSLSGRLTLVLGAGGVARSVAHALHREGALVHIANRTEERAHKLAEEIGCRALDWAARHSVSAEIVINCTPVGMHPKVDESPLHPSFLKPGLIVFDTVYNPETTLLVKEARNRGCQVLTGIDFFVRQAAAQFRLFTGQEPPLEVMYKTVKRALSPVTLREE